MRHCPICNNHMSNAFSACILQKYDTSYYHCRNCGFLQTEEPYWLDEAYDDAIAIADTGLVQRNLFIARRLSPLLYFYFGRNGRYLDIAGGYGMLVRLMRDMGFDFYWEDKYCPNKLARGFEASETASNFTALTAFEVLEHVYNPVEFIADIMSRHKSDLLICSTVLYVGSSHPPLSWSYYTFETGQHISFFQKRTLERIASRLGLKLCTLKAFQIFSKRDLPDRYVSSILTSRLATLFTPYIRLKLGSRTSADHIKLMSGTFDHDKKINK